VTTIGPCKIIIASGVETKVTVQCPIPWNVTYLFAMFVCQLTFGRRVMISTENGFGIPSEEW